MTLGKRLTGSNSKPWWHSNPVSQLAFALFGFTLQNGSNACFLGVNKYKDIVLDDTSTYFSPVVST